MSRLPHGARILHTRRRDAPRGRQHREDVEGARARDSTAVLLDRSGLGESVPPHVATIVGLTQLPTLAGRARLNTVVTCIAKSLLLSVGPSRHLSHCDSHIALHARPPAQKTGTHVWRFSADARATAPAMRGRTGTDLAARRGGSLDYARPHIEWNTLPDDSAHRASRRISPSEDGGHDPLHVRRTSAPRSCGSISTRAPRSWCSPTTHARRRKRVAS